MKALTKFFVVISLTIAGLCYTPKPAKADMFGVADAALLAQQILQFFQDMDIGDLADSNFFELIKQAREASKDIKRMVNIFNNGKQAFSVFNSVADCVTNTSRTLEYMGSYMEYIGSIGDDFEMDRCYYIYRQFNRKTNMVLDNLHRSVNEIQSILGRNSDKETGAESGTGILDMLDKVITKASSSLDTISNECISDLNEIIHENKTRNQAKAANKAINTVLI